MNTGIVVLAVFLLSCAASILLVAFRPTITFNAGKTKLKIPTYFLGVLLGAVILLATAAIPLHDAISSLEGSRGMSPLGTIVLFFSMVFISTFLDQTGFFEYCAKLSLKYSKGNPKKLFFATFITVFILTIFTSNDDDIIIFTPFIYYIAKNAKINPLPYLFAEFFAANTSSMMLYTGNPTNIILAGALGLDFSKYSLYMFLPTLAAGAVLAFGLYFIFRKKINSGKSFSSDVDMSNAIRDRTGAILGISLLLGCIIVLSFSSKLGFEMWKVSLLFALLTSLTILARRIYIKINSQPLKNKVVHFRKIFSKLPWSIIPFVISLFILVESLSIYGITSKAGIAINSAASGSEFLTVILYGFVSAISANLINNIPMTVAFVPIIGEAGSHTFAAALATAAGSNLAANITPFGALAGIMWLGIIKSKGIKLRIADFIRWGMPVTLLALAVSMCLLGLELMIF